MSINRITRKDVEVFAGIPPGALGHYQFVATKSAIYPGQGSPLGLIYCALKLNGEAGELAEHVGKAMRDDSYCEQMLDETGLALIDAKLDEKRRELIIKEVGDCLWYLSAICNELGITLHHAATVNLSKLADRTEREQLRGSGDER